MTDSAPTPRLARPPGPFRWSALLLPLTAVAIYLALRLPHLRNLPVFFDEAIYLRWAQIVAGDPAHHLFVTLDDGRAPLHIWLLALALRLHADPVTAGRLVSVACGAGALILLLPVARDIAHLFTSSRDRAAASPSESGAPHPCVHWLGPITAALFITSPFLMFYQRLAIAESLLLLEEILIVLLALRLVAMSRSDARIWPHALALGLVFGCTLLTKQNFSYLLCALPLWVAVCAFTAAPQWNQRVFQRWLSGLLLAGAVGFILWLPMLIAPGAATLRDRIFYSPKFLANAGGSARLSQIVNNISTVFIPRAIAPGDSFAIDQSWLWVYLTPPVYMLILVALIYLAWTKRLRLLIFLLGWSASILGSLVLLGSTLYSRYLILGIIPLFIALAWLIADLLSWLARRPATRYLALPSAIIGLVLLLAWPTRDALHVWDWRSTRLVTSDQWQYATGWPCGFATQQAIAYLQENSRQVPAIVLTTRLSGLPDDALWLYLQSDPNIVLLAATDPENKPLLQLGPAGGYMLRFDNSLPAPPQEIHLPDDVPIVLVTRDPLYGKGSIIKRPADFLQRLNPGTRLLQTFSNPQPAGSPFPSDNIALFLIPRPVSRDHPSTATASSTTTPAAPATMH